MLDIFFYLKLVSGLGFILAGLFAIYGYKKNPKKYKYGYMIISLLLLAGVLQLISALGYYLQ